MIFLARNFFYCFFFFWHSFTFALIFVFFFAFTDDISGFFLRTLQCKKNICSPFRFFLWKKDSHYQHQTQSAPNAIITSHHTNAVHRHTRGASFQRAHLHSLVPPCSELPPTRRVRSTCSDHVLDISRAGVSHSRVPECGTCVSSCKLGRGSHERLCAIVRCIGHYISGRGKVVDNDTCC
jgi:hypothetical protein